MRRSSAVQCGRLSIDSFRFWSDGGLTARGHHDLKSCLSAYDPIADIGGGPK